MLFEHNLINDFLYAARYQDLPGWIRQSLMRELKSRNKFNVYPLSWRLYLFILYGGRDG
jgi:hypothetical protein